MSTLTLKQLRRLIKEEVAIQAEGRRDYVRLAAEPVPGKERALKFILHLIGSYKVDSISYMEDGTITFHGPQGPYDQITALIGELERAGYLVPGSTTDVG